MFRDTPFARQVASSLTDSQLTLVHIGDGDVNPVWRLFENKLDALKIGSNVSVLDEDGKTNRLRAGHFWTRNPWGRLSVTRTLELRAARSQPVSADSAPQSTSVPDPVRLPNFLYKSERTDVDFIQLSAGGGDFIILQSLRQFLEDAGVLGLTLVVNFFGSSAPGIHTFHNVDRFMKECGFELFALTTRSYSMAALPAPYKWTYPGETEWGRPLQGEALYLRDAASPDQIGWALMAGSSKLAKLAAIFSMADLPDCAADLIIRTKPAVSGVLDFDLALHNLTTQSARRDSPNKYAEYMRLFEADDPRFYDKASH